MGRYNPSMTEAIAFDTHRFVKRLTANLATKGDIAAVEATIAQVEANLRAEIAKIDGKIEASKGELLKWMISALIAQGGLIVALVKLL